MKMLTFFNIPNNLYNIYKFKILIFWSENFTFQYFIQFCIKDKT